jgi:hypothetical protein
VLEQAQATPRNLDQVVTLLIFKEEVPRLNLGRSTHCHEAFLGFIRFSLYSSAIVPEIVPRFFSHVSCGWLLLLSCYYTLHNLAFTDSVVK